jgi:hypothetical protein
MITAAKTLAIALTAVAAAAATGVGLANLTAAPAPAIVKLERVVMVVGTRADTTAIAQLPRVVVQGRRAAHSAATVASTRAPAPLI